MNMNIATHEVTNALIVATNKVSRMIRRAN